jgi:hypothetical protein
LKPCGYARILKDTQRYSKILKIRKDTQRYAKILKRYWSFLPPSFNSLTLLVSPGESFKMAIKSNIKSKLHKLTDANSEFT